MPDIQDTLQSSPWSKSGTNTPISEAYYQERLVENSGAGLFLAIINPTVEYAKMYPDHMYVPAVAVTKGASIVAISICIFSLILSLSTGFILIDPTAATIAMGVAITFYLMGHSADAKYKNDN